MARILFVPDAGGPRRSRLRPAACGRSIAVSTSRSVTAWCSRRSNFTLPVLAVNAETRGAGDRAFRGDGPQHPQAGRRASGAGHRARVRAATGDDRDARDGRRGHRAAPPAPPRGAREDGPECALRVTPTDIRDQGKPPLLRRADRPGSSCERRSSCASRRAATSCRSSRSAARRCTTRP